MMPQPVGIFNRSGSVDIQTIFPLTLAGAAEVDKHQQASSGSVHTFGGVNST